MAAQKSYGCHSKNNSKTNNYDGATGIEETDCYCLHLSLEICGPELYILEIFKFLKLKFFFFGKRLIQDQSSKFAIKDSSTSKFLSKCRLAIEFCEVCSLFIDQCRCIQQDSDKTMSTLFSVIKSIYSNYLNTRNPTSLVFEWYICVQWWSENRMEQAMITLQEIALFNS